MDRITAWELLARSPVAILGTLDPDGAPHLVPFTFVAMDGERIVSAIDEKPKASRELKRLRNLRRDPRVTVLAHHYEDDWSQLWWVRAVGRASVREQAPTGGREALVNRYHPYVDQDLGPWIVVDVEHIDGWAADNR